VTDDESDEGEDTNICSVEGAVPVYVPFIKVAVLVASVDEADAITKPISGAQSNIDKYQEGTSVALNNNKDESQVEKDSVPVHCWPAEANVAVFTSKNIGPLQIRMTVFLPPWTLEPGSNTHNIFHVYLWRESTGLHFTMKVATVAMIRAIVSAVALLKILEESY